MSPRTTQTLYRPVGLRELELVLETGASAFPPRLPEQPIFYPVLTRAYAEQIARDWNAREAHAGAAGFVTAFEVDAEYLRGFAVQTVGASHHQELWVPAAEQERFHAHLRSRIRVLQAFYGPTYRGPTPRPAFLHGAGPREQLRRLRALTGTELWMEVAANWALVLCNVGLWRTLSPQAQGLTPAEARAALAALEEVWSRSAQAGLPLPTGVLVDA